MKAVVLSPGPSLAQYVPQPCEMLLGVNRAAVAHNVTHWLCGDTPLVQQQSEHVIGSPILVTYGGTIDALRDHGFAWRNVIESWSPLADSFLHPSVVNWPWCTFTCAIVYAAFKGATQIDVYGADWEGTEDFDGVKSGKNRTDARWNDERTNFGALCIVLAQRGIKITRHVPEPSQIT